MIASGSLGNRKIILDSQEKLDKLIRNADIKQTISSLKIENNLNLALGKVPIHDNRS